MHTDISSKGLTRHLPPFMRPYALLMRIDRPIGVWLLLLPGWWSIMLAAGGVGGMDAADWRVFVLFALGAVIMRGAGCVINDLWDRDFDAKVERTRARPLASGALSPRQALVFLLILLALGFCILLQFNGLTILLGFLSVPLIILYPLMKRITYWPQAFLGVVFNFGALMGWSAVTGALSLPAILLYIAGIFWTLAYDTIYAHQDKEDDALVGIRSTALRFGARSKMMVGVFYVLGFLFITSALYASGAGIFTIYGLMLPGLFMLWHYQHWIEDNAASSLKAFQSSRDFGLMVLVIFGLI